MRLQHIGVPLIKETTIQCRSANYHNMRASHPQPWIRSDRAIAPAGCVRVSPKEGAF